MLIKSMKGKTLIFEKSVHEIKKIFKKYILHCIKMCNRLIYENSVDKHYRIDILYVDIFLHGFFKPKVNYEIIDTNSEFQE